MSEISVVVVGSTSISSVVGNGDTVNINVGDQTVGGGNGAAATIQVGSVATIEATQSAAIVNVGTAYAAKFNFSIPRGYTGSAGPANSLSIGSVSTGTTAAVSITGTAPSQSLSFVLQPGPVGPAGPANSLSIGSVSTGTTAAVSITGAAPSQSLSFVLPQGPVGPANSLSIGSVSTGTTAAVSITGTAPSQSLSFVLPAGPQGATGPQGPAGPPINLGDETPQPLGVASAGTALNAARADHIHATLTAFPYASLTGVPSTFPPSVHSHVVADVTGLQTALDGKQTAGTYATLVGGQVPSSQLPSYVDDVIDVGGTLPSTGEVGKIYVVSTGTNVNKIYRWSGSTFIEISPSPGSTDSVTEGSTNLYHTTARAAAAAPVQSVAGRTGAVTLVKADVGLGNVDNTADTAKPISTATQTALDGKAATSHTHALADLSQSSATTGQVPTWNGTAWAAATPSGGGGGGGSYTLPTASDTVLGGVKVGSGLAINFGVLSATGPSVIIESTSANFPATGKTGNLYIASVAKTISYWTGSEYVALGGSSGGGVTPDAPTGLVGTAGDSQISLSWTAPAVVGSSAITGYKVEYTPSGGSPTTVNTGSTATSYTITSLTNGTAYTARVAAVNSVGTGTYTAASSSITPTGATFRAIPTLTSNTSDGTAEANTVGGGAVWNLFDNSASEYLTARNGSDTPKRYFQYSFASGLKSYIGGYTITGMGDKNYSIYSWEFSGSNDGTNFTLLDTQSASWASGGQTKTFTLASPANYSTYRWTLTPDGTNDAYAGLRAAQLTAVA